jgi:hypothetical protein
MAISSSGCYIASFRDALKNTIALNFGGTTPDTINCSLINNTQVFPGTTTSMQADADPATWATTNEVTGTNWATGGVALTSVTNTLTTPNLVLSAGNVSVATTTLAGVVGCVLYDTTLSPKPNLVLVYFGGTVYGTSAGTFAITWSGSGIISFAMHS